MITVGTRPEAIKMAPIINAMKQDKRFDCKVCSTGQHKEMLEQVFNWFNITPDYELDVMRPGQPLAKLSGLILSGMQDVLSHHRPDTLLVHGDTTTAFLSALAAFYNYNFYDHSHIKIGHVEAGLRTGNMLSPYPEEANRRLIGPIADFHFAPTLNSAHSLNAEGITENIFITGNSVIDALYETKERIQNKKIKPFPFIKNSHKTILVTGHRRENYGDGFKNLCHALKLIAEKYKDLNIVYPVHLNPNVQGPVYELLGDCKNIYLVDPMDYPIFVSAICESDIILTDSGGIQEEAPSLGKPVLVLREETERPEALKAGTVELVGTSEIRILNAVSKLLDDVDYYNKMANAINPYGDGLTTKRILNILAGDNPLENVFSPTGNSALFQKQA
jgi:UDP-N-acetylglucosamine 2-epimerase (non-hydrolysing)